MFGEPQYGQFTTSSSADSGLVLAPYARRSSSIFRFSFRNEDNAPAPSFFSAISLVCWT